MINYLHGDDNFSSRQKLNLLLNSFFSKNPGGKIIRIEKENFDLKKLTLEIKSNFLFNEPKIFLLEGYSKFHFQQRKQLLAVLNLVKNSEIIIWDDQETVFVRDLKKHFPVLREWRFSRPKIIFKFLEEVYPKNQKVFIPLFNALLRRQPLELIFYFLKKHCHNLIASQNWKNFPSWQQQRFKNQRQKFSSKKLTDFYLALLETEYKEKTGQLAVDFKFALVNLLLTL